MAPVDVVEPAEDPRFLPEQLHRGHAGDVLLQKRVDPGDQRPDDPVRLAGIAAEPLRDHGDQRKDRKRDQRQPPVHDHEHDHDARQHEHVAEDRHDAGREHVVQDIHVGRDPGHQAADRIAVVELHVQLLQVPVDLQAHVEHDALPGDLQRPRLQEFQREGREQDREKRQRDPIEPGQVPGLDVTVDRDLDQIGLRQLQGGRRR